MEKIIKVNPATLFLTWKFGVKAPKWFCSLHIRAWRCSLKNHTDCRKNSVRFLYCTGYAAGPLFGTESVRASKRTPYRTARYTNLCTTRVPTQIPVFECALYFPPYLALPNAGTQGRWTLGMGDGGALFSRSRAWGKYRSTPIFSSCFAWYRVPTTGCRH